MAELRKIVNDGTRSVTARNNAAILVANSLVTLYPGYAPGRVLRASLAAKMVELMDMGPTLQADKKIKDDLVRQVEADRDAAEAGDPELVRFVRLTSFNLPTDVTGELDALHAQKKEARDASVAAAINAKLDIVANEVTQLGQPLYGWSALARRRPSAFCCGR